MNKKKRIVIVSLSIAVVLIGSYIILWLWFYNNKINPIVQIADDNHYETDITGRTTGRFDSFSRDYIYGSISIGIPSFSRFSGNVSILQGTIIDENDIIINKYNVDLTVFVRLKNKYFITIYESDNNENSMVITSNAIDRFEVDKDMNILDKESHTDDSLDLFEEQKPIILELKAELMDRFGAEILFD